MDRVKMVIREAFEMMKLQEKAGYRLLIGRFHHLDKVLRDCALADDPIYKTAAELWIAIAGKKK